MTVEAICFYLSASMTWQGGTFPSSCLLSQSFLVAYFSSSSLSCCGATTHWQYLLTWLEFCIIPLSYSPGSSCFQLIDCLIKYAEIQMQNHACAVSMCRQKSTQKHPFACEDACWYMDTSALPRQLMELWFPQAGSRAQPARFAALQVWTASRQRMIPSLIPTCL